MTTILEQIVEQTAADLKKRKQKISYSDFESMSGYERERRSLYMEIAMPDTMSIIAEIKKASPSKGLIRKDFDPRKLARQYQQGGASALSVLTDEPAFKGHLDHLKIASDEVSIPLLRKDFIIDPYQIKEARAYGADAVLLIATITDGHQLEELHHAAEELGLECLVECYSEDDMQYVDFKHVINLGVNNRDLHSFEVDVHRGIALLQSAPIEVATVSESGISSVDDLILLYENCIDTALIGEHFMRQDDPGQAVQQMLDELETLIENERLRIEERSDEDF